MPGVMSDTRDRIVHGPHIFCVRSARTTGPEGAPLKHVVSIGRTSSNIDGSLPGITMDEEPLQIDCQDNSQHIRGSILVIQ